jgi:hypothetical protein
VLHCYLGGFSLGRLLFYVSRNQHDYVKVADSESMKSGASPGFLIAALLGVEFQILNGKTFQLNHVQEKGASPFSGRGAKQSFA